MYSNVPHLHACGVAAGASFRAPVEDHNAPDLYIPTMVHFTLPPPPPPSTLIRPFNSLCLCDSNTNSLFSQAFITYILLMGYTLGTFGQ